MERLLWGLGSIKGRGVGHGVCGSALSLLLCSVRTNTAYTRYWEGRGVWNRLVVASRDAAEFAGLYIGGIGGGSGPQARGSALRLSVSVTTPPPGPTFKG